jgi:hypothetical protein
MLTITAISVRPVLSAVCPARDAAVGRLAASHLGPGFFVNSRKAIALS